MKLPDFLVQLGKASPRNAKWVASLPITIRRLTDIWSLELGNPFIENVSCSFVAPCIYQQHIPAVLKIGLPHEEALHEGEGLQVLNGDPTVHLLAIDKKSKALLLERCLPGSSLKTALPHIQDKIISQVLTGIWKTNYSQKTFRPLAEMVDLWNHETYEDLAKYPDQKLALTGCRLKDHLIKTTKSSVLLATDLHAGNVLKAQRKDWLAIDLKPYWGDPAYDLTQHILNSLDRFAENPTSFLNHLALLSDVDSQRLKNWTFARLATENEGRYQHLTKML